MFIKSLGNWIEWESTPQIQAVCTLEYGLLNQPIKVHVVPERYNNNNNNFNTIFTRERKLSPRNKKNLLFWLRHGGRLIHGIDLYMGKYGTILPG